MRIFSFSNISTPIVISNYSSKDSESIAKLALIAGLGSVIVFTVFGNAVTLIAVFSMRAVQNSISNLYIASLAAADILVGGFVMSIMLLYSIVHNGVWPYSPLLCDVWLAVDLISCTISLYSICAIGIDRWLNLEKPLRIFKRNKRVAKRAIGVVWLLPMLIWLPIFSVIKNTTDTSDGSCHIEWRPKFLVPLMSVVFLYVPVLLLLILFGRISVVIRTHLSFLSKHSNHDSLTSRNNSNADLNRIERKSMKLVEENTCLLGGNQATSPYLSSTDRLTPYRAARGGKLSSPKKFEKDLRQFSKKYKRTQPQKTPKLVMNKVIVREPTTVAKPSNSLMIEEIPIRFNFSPKDELPNVANNRRLSAATLYIGYGSTDKVSGEKGSQNKLSVSRESLNSRNSSGSVITTAPEVDDNKRASVTSDTAIEFTKRLLKRRTKPPLMRAKTETILEVSVAGPSGFSGLFNQSRVTHRLSAVGEQLFSRRLSLNIFSDLFPCGSGISHQVRAAKAVGAISVCFLVCWLPFLVLWPIKTYCDDCISDRAYHLAVWANYFNSSINPVLYALCSPRFQTVFKEVFRRASRTPIPLITKVPAPL